MIHFNLKRIIIALNSWHVNDWISFTRVHKLVSYSSNAILDENPIENGKIARN